MSDFVVPQRMAYPVSYTAPSDAPLALETRSNNRSKVFGRGTHALAVMAQVVTDAIAFAAAVVLVEAPSWYGERFAAGTPHSLSAQPFDSHLWLWGCLTVALCAWFGISGAYTSRRGFADDTKRAIAAIFVVVLVGGFTDYTSYMGFSAPRAALLFLCAVALVPFGRTLVRRLLDAAGLWRVRAIILGNGECFKAVFDALMADRYTGYQPELRANLLFDSDKPMAQLATEFSAAIHVRDLETVILVPSAAEMRHMDRVIDALNLNLVPYILVPPVERLPSAGLAVQSCLNSSLIMMTSRTGLISPLARALKRAFDVIGAASLLLFLAPAFVVIAALVASSGRPIFFGHPRVGCGRKPFRCLKFRTMVTNSQEVLNELLATDPAAAAEWRRDFKLTNDPRITPIGLFLRKTSLDELPQLLNVLRGEMSLVGPRPVIDKEIAQYYGEEAFYYELVRPGITGLWQVSGRSTTGYARRVFLDAHYVRNWSLWTDITILLNTMPCVLARKGAV